MVLYVIFIFPLLAVINAQSNCSLYKLCGSYGYCYNATDEEWFCECKFWWEGPRCNRQSSSGKEVIVLGCLTAVLILLFYGLKFGRTIYLKMKATKPIKEILEAPKLINVAIEHMKKTTKLTSGITTAATIILTIVTLTILWGLLRPIHKEIVKQYNVTPTEPLCYNTTAICDILDLEDFSVFTFPFACLLIILCIVVTKRKSFMRNICHGYIAPAIPLDFLSHIDRKFAAVVFAMIADELMGIVYEAVSGSGKSGGVLVKFLLRLLQVLYMGVKFFPILAAVYIDSIFMLTCATLYAWLEYAFTIVEEGACYPDYYPTCSDYLDDSTDVNDKLRYYGTGSTLLAIQICAAIPRYLCASYVCVKLPMKLIQKILLSRKKKLSEEQKMLTAVSREETEFMRISHPGSVEMRYVRNLFISIEKRPPSRALIARLIPKFIYEWRDDFRFSSRVLCIYSSVFLLLYLVIIWVCVEFVSTIGALRKDIQDLVDAISNTLLDDESNLIQTSFPIPQLTRPFFLAVALTSTITVVQLLVLLASIRRNLLQAFRGDASEIPRRQRSEYVTYATGNFHFAGYFIGYLIWGFMIIAVFSAIVCVCLEAFVTFGNVRMLEKILKAIIPSLLLVLFKIYLNKLIAQFILLQHFGEVLALNNRRVFMIFIYFNFFLDAFLGFISSILRFVKSIIAGILYMCRLDYSILGRKLETMDSGFNAYCGFIHTECTHRHPVMLVFVSYLYNEVKKKESKMFQVHSSDILTREKSIEQKKSLRYIRKWRLAAFLVRNPAVIFFRKTYLRQLSAETRRAINDVDNNDNYNVRQGMVFYTNHMAAQRASSIADFDSSKIILTRL